MGEIGKSGLKIAESAFQEIGLVMGLLQKPVIEAKLFHHLEGGGMDRVAPKIAQKITVFFEHSDRYPRSRQEIAGHHSGRAAAHHTTRCRDVEHDLEARLFALHSQISGGAACSSET